MDTATWVSVNSRCCQPRIAIILSNFKLKALVRILLSQLLTFFDTQFPHQKYSTCISLEYAKNIIWSRNDLSADTESVPFLSLSQPLRCSVPWARSTHPYLPNKSCQDSGQELGSEQQAAQWFLRFLLMSLNTVSRKLWVIYRKKNFETNYQKGLITLGPRLPWPWMIIKILYCSALVEAKLMRHYCSYLSDYAKPFQ